MKVRTRTRLSAAALAGILATSASAATTYTVTDLDPGTAIVPIAINSFGQIIGDSTIINTAPYQYAGTAFVWQPNSQNATSGNYSVSSFGVTGAVRVAASAINSFGQVFGYYSTQAQGSSSFQSFLFTPNLANTLSGSTTNLPFTNAASTSLAGGINVQFGLFTRVVRLYACPPVYKNADPAVPAPPTTCSASLTAAKSSPAPVREQRCFHLPPLAGQLGRRRASSGRLI